MSHTPGPWRVGKDNYGGIVADHPIEGGCMGTDDVEHYGGYLIAETVAPCNKPIIAAAPRLLKALRAMVSDAESIARNSYSMRGVTFEDCFKASDPKGHKLWKRAKKAIAAAEASHV